MARPFDQQKLNYFRSLLSYDPTTGLFKWLQSRRKHAGFIQIGDVAGTYHDGYILIGIDGTQYRAHILAYWFIKGESVPRGFEIDHENRVRDDNRWNNLRLVKRSRNNHNADPSKANKSGVRGVSWVARDNKWDARIRVNGHLYLLGKFEKFEDAVSARRSAEISLLGENAIRGEVPAGAAYSPDIRKKEPPSEEAIAAANRKKSLTKRSTNSSGYPGVRMHKKSGLWHARIVVRGKELSLGYFKIFEDAVSARKQAESEHHGQERK